jgi:hypothetical protein
MATATNLSDLELEGRGVQAREIDSGEASAGDVLTADRAGGATWAAPAGGESGGGGPCASVVWLGALGTDEAAVMNGDISAAYQTATGVAPANGAVAGFADQFEVMPQVAVYWADQGVWRGLMGAAFYS